MADWDAISKAKSKLRDNKVARADKGPAKVPVEQIVVVDQVRKNFDDIEELADSIRKNGLLQPIIVCIGEKPGTFELLYGERRFRACQIAGLKDVHVVVQARPATASQRRTLQMTENLHRQGLLPMEYAVTLSEIKEENNFSNRELAEHVSKDLKWVGSHLALLKGSQELRELLYNKQIVDTLIAHGIVQLEESNPDIAKSLIGRIKQGGTVTRAEVREILRTVKAEKKKAKQPDSAKSSTKEADTAEREPTQESPSTDGHAHQTPPQDKVESLATGDGHAHQKTGGASATPPIASESDFKAWRPRKVEDLVIRVRVEHSGYIGEGKLLIDRADEDPNLCWVMTDDELELRLPLSSVAILNLK